MPEAFCGLETVRQKALFALCALWEKKLSTHTPTMFFFSQKNTEEQNTQRPTETLSQPISQSVTANVSWKASVNSVRERTTQELSSVLSLTVGAFYFSQKNTDEQNSQRPTETLSQPMTQTLSTKIVYNVLWYLSSACRHLWVPPLAAWPLFICENLWEIKLPTPQDVRR